MKLITKGVFVVSLVLGVSVFSQLGTLAQGTIPYRDTKSQGGCLAGYPDGTFKGSRPVTRYEFAHSMNACLEQLNQLLPNQENLATKADFEALIIRQQELNRELRQLNQPVGNSPNNTRSQAEYPFK